MNKKLLQAFTLIELLVVIAIIGILSGLIIVGMSSSTQSATIAKAQIFSSSLRNSLLINLVSEWKLSEGSGTNISDYWAENDATLVCPSGNCWLSGNNCINGSCLSLPGNDISFLRITDSTNLHFGDVTLSFWTYNGNGTSSWPTLYNRNGSNSTVGFWWVYTTSSGRTITWRYANGTTNPSIVWSDVFPVNVWSYLTFNYNNTSKTIDLLINGVSQGKQNAASAIPVTSGTLYIGSYQGGAAASYAYAGRLGEIRIYDTTIPTSLINEQYFTGLNHLLTKSNISLEEYKNRINNSIN